MPSALHRVTVYGAPAAFDVLTGDASRPHREQHLADALLAAARADASPARVVQRRCAPADRRPGPGRSAPGGSATG